ncbi:hypothetical protein V1477_007335 [Vespula maculifrons]|uniref:Uncharacterized protein n=1 Tax=Vespula maculifrons TaxID=7453 RepID=A0ABD2CI73_VESMC
MYIGSKHHHRHRRRNGKLRSGLLTHLHDRLINKTMKGLDILKKQYWMDDWDKGTQGKLENKDRTLVAISSDQVGDGTGLISAVMHYLTSILAELQRTYSASSNSAIVEYVDEVGRTIEPIPSIAAQNDGIVKGLKGGGGSGEGGGGGGGGGGVSGIGEGNACLVVLEKALADHVGIKHTRIQMVGRGKGPLAAETGESFRLNVRDVGRPGYEETRGKRGLKGRWWVAGTECNIW